jgi:threonylcarbamoyladenosine tRNA methylthiotransferase MtaB
MKRRYSISDFQRAVSLIRELLPNVAITTDVIVGFPGESQAEFEQSYDFCRRMAFTRIHVFPFSSRPGTSAAGMPKQVNASIRKQRCRRMLGLAKESAEDFRRHFLGKVMHVLWEKQKGSILEGLTGNYIQVYTRNKEDLPNQITEVKLEKLYKGGVWGRL